MAVSTVCADHCRTMSERGFHYIQDDLSETWLEDWAGAGVGEMESYLAKHAAFHEFLETDEASS
jgi:hypothetical protein